MEGKEIMGIYSTNEIYKNKELSTFLDNLEKKYDVKRKREEYQYLVNFSKNSDIAFHNWFRYREGFARELIEKILKLNNTTNDTLVIDPFVGSGTTSVVASLLGFNTFSLDINPISSFITNTKLSKYNDSDLTLIKEEIEIFQTITNDSIKKEIVDNHTLVRYFSHSNLRSLLSIKKHIEDKINDSKIKNFFNCAFLCIIEDVSDRRRDGNGLKTVLSKINNVFAFYIEKCNSMLTDLISVSDFLPEKSVCVHGSAMDLYTEYKKKYTAKQLDNKVIIFSPPYPNSFDYFESYKLELVLGGFASDIKDISKYRKNAVRSFIGREGANNSHQYINNLADEIFDRIPLKEEVTGKKDSRTRKVPAMIQGYFEDMREVLNQCYKLLDTGNEVYIVVDQSAYLGVVIPTDLILAYLAEEQNFLVVDIIDCRSARTSAQQLKKYPYLKGILRESIIILKK